mgnify:CR=1 FL=1
MDRTLPTPTERFIRGILPENPVLRQVLGICPTLAVTNTMEGAMTMAGAVLFVLTCANVLVSLLRPLLKPHLRILVFTLTIATFVTIADRLKDPKIRSPSKWPGSLRCAACGGRSPIGLNSPSGLFAGAFGPKTRCLRHLRRRCNPTWSPAGSPRVPCA